MQALNVRGIFAWSLWQPDRNLFFTSHFLVREGGNVAIDPLPTTAEDARHIEALGGVAQIVLTNRDHERGAAEMRDRFGARILASAREAQRCTVAVDATLDDADLPGIVALALDGAKTPGEVALWIPKSRTAIVGDALIGAPAGSLSFLPDEKLADPQALALSLRKLWALQPETLLLGDGASLFAGVDTALGEVLETRGGPAVNRINLDELDWVVDADDPPEYVCESAEIGLFVGARKLGYRAAKLPPGSKFCPLHSHDVCEEMFYVLDGSPTIRTLRGDVELRPGDFIAFPVGDRGAHQVINRSNSVCTVLLLGLEEDDEVCYYPDSRKVLAARRGLMMREDRLDYYDGE